LREFFWEWLRQDAAYVGEGCSDNDEGEEEGEHEQKREKVVMMRERTRILWKKTELMDRKSSVQCAKFEVYPLPVYEKGPYKGV